MSEWEEDLLALFDSLDEAARAEALAAALKIIGGEIPLRDGARFGHRFIFPAPASAGA